jgi:hypothetical protein
MLTVYNCIVHQHDLRLVVLAAVICTLASFAALTLLHHVRKSIGLVRCVWLAVSAISSGFGIWATHFIAMLAFSPGIPSGYNIILTFLSLIAAIILTGAGSTVAVMTTLPGAAWLGGAIVGGGIATMHYTGMAAFEVEGLIIWDPELVAVSIALGALIGAVSLSIGLRDGSIKSKIYGALLLTVAICSHHFTAMGAVSILPDPTIAVSASALPARWLAIVVALASFAIILLAFGGVALDMRDRRRAEAARAAEAANEAKTSFLAMMSHEIRTPMNAVLGLASALMDTKLDTEQHSAVAAIYDAGDNLLRLLNDILDFSKLESGRLSLEAIAFSPAALVHDAVSIVRPRASAKGLAIRTAEDSVLPPALLGDAGRIRQIFLNFLSNALKFTQVGEVVISARCLRRDEASATIEWSVSDTGIGIPQDRIKDLFTDFMQADSSISRRFGGSGLGLAICKRLAEQMGGEISVISTLGQGSTFRIRLSLPIAEQAAPVERADHEHSSDFDNVIAALGRPVRVLITDDDATNRLVAARMLKGFDAQINIACNGIEAVAATSSFPYDVILMDMRMPEMDGLQATRAIRARGGRLATIPIIAFTANAFPEDLQACQEAGMNDFVAKPVRKKVLIETMARVLRSLPAGAIDKVAEVTAPPIVPRQVGHSPADEAAPGRGDADHVQPVMERSDHDKLVEEIGEESALEMLDVFLRETVARLTLLNRLACPNDRLQIEREAHSLKSTSRVFGLKRLSELARALEVAASDLSDAEFRVSLDQIERAFDEARAQLSAQFTTPT